MKAENLDRAVAIKDELAFLKQLMELPEGELVFGFVRAIPKEGEDRNAGKVAVVPYTLREDASRGLREWAQGYMAKLNREIKEL